MRVVGPYETGRRDYPWAARLGEPEGPGEGHEHLFPTLAQAQNFVDYWRNH